MVLKSDWKLDFDLCDGGKERQRISVLGRIDIWDELDEQVGGSKSYVAATISTGVQQRPMERGDGLMRLRHVEVAIKDLVKATPDAACC